jgi:hypothetical protein
MEEGERNRHYGKANMISDLQGPTPSSIYFLNHQSWWGTLASKLLMVDLAGSKSVKQTGALGDLLKEAVKINLALRYDVSELA